ncbi:MAG: glycoside hydrolase family 97 protein [FCB group bacterium]|nr:glycoside hydrolase family 97 protein [FCB group bacterium]MBL7026982.1 glycoside hydrolase family 97 protein [Candidatus Neomarinimicrobiota bacterium]MBL7122162.1 glycoside hydrolase family 97 protein [Candidatus Neomarinimicrobiota bacterium]
MNKALILIILFVYSCKSEISDNIVVISPDDKIQVELKLDQGMPQYAIHVDGKKIFRPSVLGYRFRDQPDLVGPFQLVNSNTDMIEEDWEPVWGQEKSIHSLSKMIKLELRERLVPHRQLNLYFRVFNDGVAFRYEIPEQASLDSLFIIEELSEFRFARDGKSWWIPGSHAFDSYEQLHQVSLLSEIDSANTPLTYISEDDLFISIHEANLTDYAGMTLKRSRSDSLNFLSNLVPWPDGDLVKTTAPMHSPWRTICIGRSATDLLRSRMILNLNEPNQLSDVSWIKPMKYVGIWWGMHINKYTWVQGDQHGATTENAKRYIDFASEHDIQGVLAEGWNRGWEAWGQEGALQLTEAYDDFDIVEVVEYAKEKNVTFIGHHETTANVAAYEHQLESAFAYYDSLDISAIKTGYVGAIKPSGQFHYGQWMVEHFRRVVKLAATHHISLDVHEPVKGTGIERTWSNMMTREGARGQEWNAWSEGNPPDHTTILPFTRLLAGPLDYTPGIFDIRFDDYKPENKVHSTLAKQLALMVVLYSPLQMAADLPENYENQPAFQFIQDLEVDWDETLYLEGEIGKYVTIARRHGSEWFLGAITNGDAREVEISMNQMVGGDQIAECYVDTEDAHWDDNPYRIWIGSYKVSPTDTLKARLAPGGGMAIRLRPLTEEEMEHELLSISDLRQDQGARE